ncbi:hypothetical protein MMC21_005413 [Puttea exsequens]|nr:hypothetical protein [Puttea exsequens]
MSDEHDSKLSESRKVLGSGLKRKPIDFVPASSHTDDLTCVAAPSVPIGDKYLAIVLKNGAFSNSSTVSDRNKSNTPGIPLSQGLLKDMICEVCRFPINRRDDEVSVGFKPHASSMAHQICLAHSYPPSDLDRKRHGVKYLSSYGWDPDSRRGLGASEEGIRVPIKAKIKNNTVGLGVEFKHQKELKKKVERLDAKQMRRKETEDRRKREKLQDIFYRSHDIVRYLGPG